MAELAKRTRMKETKKQKEMEKEKEKEAAAKRELNLIEALMASSSEKGVNLFLKFL